MRLGQRAAGLARDEHCDGDRSISEHGHAPASEQTGALIVPSTREHGCTTDWTDPGWAGVAPLGS